MKSRPSLAHACVAGSALVVLPAFFASACSPDEILNPAPVNSTSSSSTSSSSGEGGQGAGPTGGAGGMPGSVSSSSSSGMGGAGGIGGSGPSSSSSNSSSSSSSSGSSGQMGGAGGFGVSSSTSSGQVGGFGGIGVSSTSSGGAMGGFGGIGVSSTSSGGAMGGFGGMGTTSGMGGGGIFIDGGPGPVDGSVCPSTTMAVPVIASPHVAACSVVTYSTNPPTSGPHYPNWAAFKWYSSPLPRGFAVHSMEHGAVVFSYNCPMGCTAELNALQAFLNSRPADPMCTPPVKARIIVTPDPLIDSKFAVAAWGALYKGDCLDFAAIGAFLDMYYAKAPENFCFDGIDVLSADAGTPPDCGNPADAGMD